MLLSAQSNAHGIPDKLIELKRQEMETVKADAEKMQKFQSNIQNIQETLKKGREDEGEETKVRPERSERRREDGDRRERKRERRRSRSRSKKRSRSRDRKKRSRSRERKHKHRSRSRERRRERKRSRSRDKNVPVKNDGRNRNQRVGNLLHHQLTKNVTTRSRNCRIHANCDFVKLPKVTQRFHLLLFALCTFVLSHL